MIDFKTFPARRNRKHRLRNADDAAGKETSQRSRAATAVNLRMAVCRTPQRIEPSSMFCHRLVGRIEDGFGKGKFEDDLAFLIGHFENRIQKTTPCVFGLQQFPDHGARDFPCTIRISQLFAFRIGDQFVGDTRVEKISGHRRKAIFVEGSSRKPRALTGYLFGTRHANIAPQPRPVGMAGVERLDVMLL
jgi:hypothetical protein